MCGRFQLDFNIEQLMMRFDARNNYIGYGSKKEIFPTDTVAIVTRKENQNIIEPAKWGLDNPFDKRPLINARCETIDEKKTFKNLFLESRCIIPATAFFEWKTENRKKLKYYIKPEHLDVFGMAGLYKVDKDEHGNPLMRFIIITTAASKDMSEVHDRMPVILPRDHENLWMDPSIKDSNLLKEFIKNSVGILSLTAEAKETQLSFC